MKNNRFRWIFGFILIFVMAGAVDFLFLHFLFPIKKAAMIEEITREVEQDLRDDPPTHDEPSAPSTTSPAPTQNSGMNQSWPLNGFREARVRCFGKSLETQNPTELLQTLMEKEGVKSRSVSLENWHIGRPDGTEERIMRLVSDKPESKGRFELRWFGVDHEGLPVPRELDPKKAHNPSPEFIASLKSRGEILFHQVREEVRLGNGAMADVEWIDGSARDVQIFMRNRTFSCRNLDCQCRTSEAAR